MKEHDFNIRKLAIADVHIFRRLRIAAAVDSPQSIYPDPEEIAQLPVAELQKQMVGDPFPITYGAFAEDELIAIAGLRRESMTKTRHRASVCFVFTAKSHRRKGIARKLMDALLLEVMSRSELTMLNLAVHSQNAAAKALYASMGFVSYGLQQNTLLVDGEYIHEELMALTLR